MAKKKKLFGNNIEPACAHCEYGRLGTDKQMVLCRKFGPVAPYYHCKKYEYDPLKRIPRRPPSLPKYSEEDFKL